jgi:lipopolysaccharide export system protein LptA
MPAVAAPKDSALSGDGLLGRFALSADRGPVTITADVLEFDYRAGLLIYRGNVVVKQGDVTLSSDTLRLALDLEDIGRPREIVADGRVRIARGDRIATGGRAVFDQAEQTITLSDEAVLRDGQNEVAGQKVVVYLEEERSVVEGGEERVRAKLFPNGGGDETTDPSGGADEP